MPAHPVSTHRIFARGSFALRASLLVAVVIASISACDDGAAKAAKLCNAAIADAKRAIKSHDLTRAKKEQATATKACVDPKQRDEAVALGERITTAEAVLEEQRKKQDKKDKAEAAKKKAKRGAAPVIGSHSKEIGATGVCKDYVDCACGLADGYRYETAEDSHREFCTDAKKVLGGKNSQGGCQNLMDELKKQGDKWKEPFESQGVTIPTSCP